jgi:NodT family efflux transporter outer membrane factor (OMF) lipoprotein
MTAILVHRFKALRPRALPALVLVWSLASCAVGPDYVPPQTASPPAWRNTAAQTPPAAPAPSQLAVWWQSFGDPVLGELIDRAVAGNLDLKLALARVREARAQRGIQEAALYPTVDASGTYTRYRRSENNLGDGAVHDLYSAGFDAGWEIDVFGGLRRGVEAADAQLQASQADLDDVLVSLLAETGLNYLDARTFQARLKVAQENLGFQQETYDLVRSRFEAGLSDELALQQARYNLASTRARVPSLRAGLEAALNRLAVLTGAPPGAVHEAMERPEPIPVPPPTVAVGVPAETLRRRPDIRRSERELAAQTARIGEATADLYPKFNLAGFIGIESLTRGDFLEAKSRAWTVVPGVTWRLFDAGAIRQNIAVQTARQEQALLRYEAAILQALEEVEDTLKAYVEEALRHQALRDAAFAARQAVVLAEERYKAGLVDFNNVLDAQRSLLNFQDQLAISEGTVTADLVRLYKALGGGWDPRRPPAP